MHRANQAPPRVSQAWPEVITWARSKPRAQLNVSPLPKLKKNQTHQDPNLLLPDENLLNLLGAGESCAGQGRETHRLKAYSPVFRNDFLLFPSPLPSGRERHAETPDNKEQACHIKRDCAEYEHVQSPAELDKGSAGKRIFPRAIASNNPAAQRRAMSVCGWSWGFSQAPPTQTFLLPSHAVPPYGSHLSVPLITSFGFHFHRAQRTKWGCFMDKSDRSRSKINIQFEIRTEQAAKLF